MKVVKRAVLVAVALTATSFAWAAAPPIQTENHAYCSDKRCYDQCGTAGGSMTDSGFCICC